MRPDHGEVLGERQGSLDGTNALFDDLWIAHIVFAKERFQRGLAGVLYLLERRPALEEIAKEYGIAFLKPVQGLGEVLLERAGELVGDAAPVIDQAAALFHQVLQGTHGAAGWLKAFEFVGVMEQKIELQFSVGRVILGMARGEGLAVFGEG